jgi:uncharacterized protein involved in exopolysaccharide biosynthesis
VHRYKETFLRHKIALTLPIVIALAFSMFYAMKAPKTYATSMNLWFDTAAPNASSLQQLPNGVTPATQGQQVLEELLGTGQFLDQVAKEGNLLGSSSAAATSPAAEGAAVAALGKAFTVTTTGPQVVQVTMTGHDPYYMKGTLKAVADQYSAQVTKELKARDGESVAYFQAQVAAATSDLEAANAKVSAYMEGKTPGYALTVDPGYTQLTQAAVQAQTNLSSAESSLQQAQLQQQGVQDAVAFHVIDPPGTPVAKSSKKHEILIGAAGLIVGIVVTMLALSAITGMDKTARSEEDIDGMLGINVVASISDLPRRRPRFPLPKTKHS